MVGRPSAPIWVHFDKVGTRATTGKQRQDAKCKHCTGRIPNAQPGRQLIAHAVVCEGLSQDERGPWAELLEAPKRARQQKRRTPKKRASPASCRSPSVSKRLFQTPPSSSCGHSTPCSNKKSTKEESFARVVDGFYATGIPFRCVEEPYFQGMFDYELSSRKLLAGRLLDSAYARQRTDVMTQLAGKKQLALVTDGWMDTNNASIINYMLTNPLVPPVFWSSANTGTSSHTGDFIATEIVRVIEEVHEAVPKCTITSVVTDAAANMASTWENLERSGHGILCSGSAAHGTNLLMKDIFALKEFVSVLSKATTLVKFIKKRHALWDRFRGLQRHIEREGAQRRILATPVPTRWYSHERCVRSVAENRDVLETVFANIARFGKNPEKLEKANAIVQDEAFRWPAQSVLDLIYPVNQALAAFEPGNCCISVVFQEFERLLSSEVYTKRSPTHSFEHPCAMLMMIEERRAKICNDKMRLAHYLDQTQTLDGFVEADVRDIIDYGTQLAQQLNLVDGQMAVTTFHTELEAFGLAKSTWVAAERGRYRRFSPVSWWTLNSTYPNVREFALRILSIPTSSASSERSWSIHGFIHSRRRNRLTAQRVEKLVFVYSNMAKKGAPDHVLYDLYPDAGDDEDTVNDRDVLVHETQPS